MVECDIYPNLVEEYSDLLAIPLCRIYNCCLQTGLWPSLWKNETVVVIPKNKNPNGLNDLRNLSCTPLFSKILETIVLERLKKETSVRPNQYGGIKGSSTELYLISAWNKILEALDDGSAVASFQHYVTWGVC